MQKGEEDQLEVAIKTQRTKKRKKKKKKFNNSPHNNSNLDTPKESNLKQEIVLEKI